MFVSPAEAIRRFDVSKPTLYNDMKDGKLSFSLDDRGRRKINIAELERLYDKRAGEAESAPNGKNGSEHTQLNVNLTAHQIARLEQEVAFLKREIENKQQETEKWQEAFNKSQATADKITTLLEDHSRSSRKADDQAEWEKSLKALEARIANQEKAKKEETERAEKMLRQNKALRKALDEEKNKSVWQKLFG